MDANWNAVDDELNYMYQHGFPTMLDTIKAMHSDEAKAKVASSDIWYQDIASFLDTKKLLEIWPTNVMSIEERINATTRFILITCIVIGVTFRKSKYIIFGMLLVGMLAYVYHDNTKVKDT